MDEGSVLILGEGRIAKAIFYYLKRIKEVRRVKFFFELSDKRKIKEFCLIISALPGKDGALGLELALKNRINLLDLTDLDPPFYLKNKEKINKLGILVIPGCGFCPGLLNFILGYELFLNPNIDSVFVEAGSFSSKGFFFPYLWCFEDLILEHQLSSRQIISGRKVRLPPFSGYRKEKFLGLDLESYYSVSGFENMLNRKKFNKFVFRVIRPLGFMHFFCFLKNHGFLDKENIEFTKKILEAKKENNFTFAKIELLERDKMVTCWQIKSFSKKNSILNSMQKITALVAVNICRQFFLKNIKYRGLIFLEDLGEDKIFFKKIIEGIKKEDVSLKRIHKLKKGVESC